MTIRYATNEVETHPGRFPAGLDTPVEEIYKAQGEAFFAPPMVWMLTELSPYSGELPKVTAYRTHAGAKAAMEEDIRKTLASDSPAFDGEDLVREDDDHASIGDEVHWRIEQAELLD